MEVLLMFCALLISVLFATLTKIKSVEPPISDEDLLATQYDHITRQVANIKMSCEHSVGGSSNW